MITKNTAKKCIKLTAVLLACLMIAVSFPPSAVQAEVTDNIGTAVIEQTIGSWEDTSDAHSVIGLLRLIIEKIVAQLQKLDELEAKVDILDDKIDVQTTSLQESIENSAKAANASHNLYVYIPKTQALADYSGQKVKLTSETGNQNSSAVLRDDGTNYSATLYFNFSGNCKLNYVAKNESDDPFDITETVNITSPGQEYQLGSTAYRVKLFLPKSASLAAYAGQQIKITSNTDSQSSVATFSDDGSNYSAVIYVSSEGSCLLEYPLLNRRGEQIEASEQITVSSAVKEIKIGTITNVSWNTIHNICQSNSAADFGITSAGTQLPGGWYVIGSGTDDNGKDTLRIWNKSAVGSYYWWNTNSIAQSYYTNFNTKNNTIAAYKSGLLSKADVSSGWLANNRGTGSTYWLETLISSGNGASFHCYVGDNGYIYTNTGYDTNDEYYQYGCCPYVWIN